MKKTYKIIEENILLYPNNIFNKRENWQDFTKNIKFKGQKQKKILTLKKKNFKPKIKEKELKKNNFKSINKDSISKSLFKINNIKRHKEGIKNDRILRRIIFPNFKTKKTKKAKYSKTGYSNISSNVKKILLFFIIFIINIFLAIFIFKIYSNSKIKKISLIIPIAEIDFYKITQNIKFFKKFIIDLKNIVLIGDEKIANLIGYNKSFEVPIIYFNENKLIDVDKIKNLIGNRNKYASKRAGWYIQQFLKMEYYKICKDKYYLIWDGDTIPIRYINMFNNESKPYFDVKTEYHKPYFITMKKLFPDLGKKHSYSFISEHMLIKTEIMKDLINRINNNTKIDGEKWYEKIINSIDINDLRYSGFSEYETYGTFTKEYYSKVYEVRHFKSLRGTRKVKNYNFNSLSFNIIQNISKEYDAITFEK